MFQNPCTPQSNFLSICFVPWRITSFFFHLTLLPKFSFAWKHSNKYFLCCALFKTFISFPPYGNHYLSVQGHQICQSSILPKFNKRFLILNSAPIYEAQNYITFTNQDHNMTTFLNGVCTYIHRFLSSHASFRTMPFRQYYFTLFLLAKCFFSNSPH